MVKAKVSPDIAREVGPLELFFDLVFVFAVSQLSHHLLTHLSWRGCAETAVLLVATFGVWAYTSFETTIRDVERKQTQRTVLAVMFLGLFMNAFIGSAFSSNPWPFVVPYLVSLAVPAAITSMEVGSAALRSHYRRALAWVAIATPPVDRRRAAGAGTAAGLVGCGGGGRPGRDLAGASAAGQDAALA